VRRSLRDGRRGRADAVPGLDRRLLGPMLIYLFGFAAMEAARGDGGGPSDEDFENGLAWLVRGVG